MIDKHKKFNMKYFFVLYGFNLDFRTKRKYTYSGKFVNDI